MNFKKYKVLGMLHELNIVKTDKTRIVFPSLIHKTTLCILIVGFNRLQSRMHTFSVHCDIAIFRVRARIGST